LIFLNSLLLFIEFDLEYSNQKSCMPNLIKLGRLFYGLGIIAFGVQQLIILDFRPQIVPEFPSWAHQYAVLPIITGLAMIIIGSVIAGWIPLKMRARKNICLYLAGYFLLLILVFHLPFRLVVSPNKAYHLGVWAETLKELAYCGGALVIARSFTDVLSEEQKQNGLTNLLEKLIPLGRIFFCTTMILFGYSHFLYAAFVSPLVPSMFGAPFFWTYFAGVALIGAGIAIILRLFVRPIALLLALMIFLWFIVLHVPIAIRHPYQGRGNEIVSAFDALLFSGVALVIALTVHSRTRSASKRRPEEYHNIQTHLG
jgi:uncharacterized membrane protein YphA (DoxX/SURF4 family)